MSPVTHFLSGWVLANTARLNHRERMAITIAAIVPDVDGLGAPFELMTRHTAHPLLWFSQYHHSLHTLLFGLIVAAVTFAVSDRRWLTAALAFLAFHVHLLEDLVGSRGPDGYAWPVPYLRPFSARLDWLWSGQWALNGWQNVAITLGLLAATIIMAVRQGRSPVELISADADASVVSALRRRFS